VSELPLPVYLFALFSLFGWVLEVCFRSARQKKLVDPGFLAGPYLPLYGASVLALTCCIIHLNKGLLEPFVADLIDNAMPPVGDRGRLLVAAGALILSKAVLYFFVTTGMELVTGLASRRLLNRQLWDYSGETFCIGNSVCLKFSCLWVALAFFYEYVAFPAALSLGRSLDPVLLSALGLGVCLAMFFDFCLQMDKVVKTRRILSAARTEENHREFSEIVRPLLEKEELRRLAHFRHHWNKTRLETAGYYNMHMRDLPLVLPTIDDETSHIFHHYVIRTVRRDALQLHLREKGIMTGIYYPLPLHLQPCFSYLGYKEGDLPIAEEAARTSLAIPVFPELKKREKDYIIKVIRSFFEKTDEGSENGQ